MTRNVLMPPWFDDLCAAKVALVGGMLVTWPIDAPGGGFYMGASRIYDVLEGVGPIGQPAIPPGRVAVPDLRDRATFLLVLDELARRMYAWPLVAGQKPGTWALMGQGDPAGMFGNSFEDLAHALRVRA